MIIFLNEDRGYLNWVKQHHDGYVLAGRRTPRLGQCLIHRATCVDVKQSAAHKRVHWTTGAKFKACSMDRDELRGWCEEQSVMANLCEACRPEQELQINEGKQLTKQSADVLDYVLEAALIHLDSDSTPYRLTAGDIAVSFNKTLGQMSPVLCRLVDRGFIAVVGQIALGSTIRPNRIVLPTSLALRTLESFAAESESAIAEELAKLQSEST